MKIADIEAIPIAYPEPNDNGGQRHLLLVRLTADDGQVGWGEAVTMWPEASLATRSIVHGLAPLIINHDPREHARLHRSMTEHCWWYGVGGIASFAIAAIDIALWDLAGKAAGLNVVDLIGGAVHESLPILVSCHAMEADLDEMAATMAGWVHDSAALGIKVGFGKKGNARLGVDASRDAAFVAALRRELGPDKAIMIDIGASVRWDVRTAVQRTLAFEQYGLDWIEEPLGADNPAGYHELRTRTTTRIAYGEREWTPRGVQRIVDTGTVDVVGVDPGRCEGITGWLAAAAHIQSAGAQVNAHTWSGAIIAAASLALSLASPNCQQIEVKPLRNPMQHELPNEPIVARGGHLTALSAPGLGIEINEAVVQRYRRT
jgi:L-alanine-DL-glutamate epimerase-like enolase superfamily enzyme